MQVSEKISNLIEKGVRIPHPASVDIGAEVSPDRIAPDTVLFPGSRIYGHTTLIGPGSAIGGENPATVIDCQLGSQVQLKGGFFKASVFLDGVSIGSGAQVREGCLLEEESGGNHTVGLKQTILFPFVTLGSLINFCDCFMAGGTDRRNHSEVGSSFIHFNYTPNQDKATPSLLGDVPKGVMLDQPPIFLGGQGGLVGPVRIGFGAVTPAGSVIRRDCLKGGKILSGVVEDRGGNGLAPGLYRDIRRRVTNNVYYLANLLALKTWYAQVRRPFFESQQYGAPLATSASALLYGAIDERLKRFGELAEKMEDSIRIGETRSDIRKTIFLVQRELLSRWPDLLSCFRSEIEEKTGARNRDRFLEGLQRWQADGYIQTIRQLPPEVKLQGTGWLQAIVAEVVRQALELLPACCDANNEKGDS